MSAPTRRAFTLIELLVVIAIIALLIGILLPSMGKARDSARTLKCLVNLRSMSMASYLYTDANDGRFITVGLGHGGSHGDEEAAWINTLRGYYDNPIVARSPVDTSPHWPEALGGPGVPVESTSDQFRRTSYGVNNYLTPLSPLSRDKHHDRYHKIPQPDATVQFVMMAYEGKFAGADHTHIENWVNPFLPGVTPQLAAGQVQINAHGGEQGTANAESNYGYLDGHAETRAFEDVYESFNRNQFDPRIARRF
ncbi:MAG: prepilin-type N-terminal cleavage/methylation domain-containing protein [Planctomycetota bacterium]